MKRTYNKPIMLDTCVAEYLLGVKCEHDEIVQKNINEDLLIKYVKHHGFIMSVFSLFELLRKENNISDILIKNLKKFDVKIYTPYTHDKDIFGENYINELNNKDKVKRFLDTTNKQIVLFASKNLSQTLMYPMSFLLFGMLNHFSINGVEVDTKKVNKKIRLAIEIISQKLYEKILIANYYQKSKVLKIINCVYKWIAKHLFDWFNNEANDVIISIDSKKLYDALDILIEKLNSINLDNEVDVSDHSIRADGAFNMLFVLCEKMKETHKFENVDIDDLFMQKNLDIIKIIYHTHERTISNIYLEKNIYDLYLSHIRNKKGLSEPELKLDKIFDSNDIIDLLSCKFAYDNQYKFITTDGKINGIISQVESDISVNKLFIKNIK